MEEYRHGSHTLFRLHVHVAWITKYRKGVLRGHIALRLRDLARQICSDMGVEILSGVVTKDHMHMLLSIPPQVSVSKVVEKVKGKTSYKLQREFQALLTFKWVGMKAEEAQPMEAESVTRLGCLEVHGTPSRTSSGGALPAGPQPPRQPTSARLLRISRAS